MTLLTKAGILQSLENTENESLFVEPLLDPNSQIGEATLDLRIGYDFLVSIMTRKPFISLDHDSDSFRSAKFYSQLTRRNLGDKFVLYPNQAVLTTTLEYVSLPNNIYADILTRSSYTKLGIHINTMIQPGFRGCIPLELFNHSNNAVELIVGSRVVQVRFIETDSHTEYDAKDRKYHGCVRPIASRAAEDDELKKLISLGSS